MHTKQLRILMNSVNQFETHRNYLHALAYRMLGSITDAEDMVQDTYMRWQKADQSEIGSLQAWLTQVCTRLCLDRLKSAQRQREVYPGEWLPEPYLDGEHVDPVELDESLSIALMCAIEKLKPAERAAFLLHDVFSYSHSEVAAILSISQPNSRQLVSRARRHLQSPKSVNKPNPETVERITEAFFQAVKAGDMQQLKSLLADEVVLHADGGGKAKAAIQPIEGAHSVATFMIRVAPLEPIERRESDLVQRQAGTIGLQQRKASLRVSLRAAWRENRTHLRPTQPREVGEIGTRLVPVRI